MSSKKVSRVGIYLPKALEKVESFQVSSFVWRVGEMLLGFPVNLRILCFEYCVMSTLIEEVLINFKYDKKCSTKSKLKRYNCLTGSIFLIVMFEVIADVFSYEKKLFICITIVSLLPLEACYPLFCQMYAGYL